MDCIQRKLNNNIKITERIINMSKNIKLSPKHGLNPTIPVCFFCGKDKNEIALLGKINRDDSEAPLRCVIDYEPCDECKKIMNQGITFIEASETPQRNGQQPFNGNKYLTGKWCVVSEDFVKRNVKDKDAIKKILKSKMTLIAPGVIDMFGQPEQN